MVEEEDDGSCSEPSTSIAVSDSLLGAMLLVAGASVRLVPPLIKNRTKKQEKEHKSKLTLPLKIPLHYNSYKQTCSILQCTKILFTLGKADIARLNIHYKHNFYCNSFLKEGNHLWTVIFLVLCCSVRLHWLLQTTLTACLTSSASERHWDSAPL